ncbi:MAG: hypothetical protein ACRDB0_00375 [Paraclostridium sp.]
MKVTYKCKKCNKCVTLCKFKLNECINEKSGFTKEDLIQIMINTISSKDGCICAKCKKFGFSK